MKINPATLTLAALVALATVGIALRATAQTAGVATAQTVWVGGKGTTDFAIRLNNMHADMAAKGFAFAAAELYAEDGDMAGFFVTYVRN